MKVLITLDTTQVEQKLTITGPKGFIFTDCKLVQSTFRLCQQLVAARVIQGQVKVIRPASTALLAKLSRDLLTSSLQRPIRLADLRKTFAELGCDAFDLHEWVAATTDALGYSTIPCISDTSVSGPGLATYSLHDRVTTAIRRLLTPC